MPRRSIRQRARRPDDSSILNRWIELHSAELYRFAFRVCGNADAAEDLVQETFFEAWRHRAPLRTINEPRAWLFVVLRRRYAGLRRLEQRRPWFVSLATDQHDLAALDPAGDRIDALDSIQAGLDSMSDLFKLPLLMVFMQGLTCAQAAEELELPLGTVLSRIHRAKRHLREVMQRQETAPSAQDRRAAPIAPANSAPRLRIGGVQ